MSLFDIAAKLSPVIKMDWLMNCMSLEPPTLSGFVKPEHDDGLDTGTLLLSDVAGP